MHSFPKWLDTLLKSCSKCFMDLKIKQETDKALVIVYVL